MFAVVSCFQLNFELFSREIVERLRAVGVELFESDRGVCLF